MTKTRPRLGDTLYRVEWCSKLAFDDDGYVDFDRCTNSHRTFRERAQAVAFAEKVWPQTCDKLGVVQLDLIEFVPYDDDDASTMPHVGYWECRSDGEVFSGEWEK